MNKKLLKNILKRIEKLLFEFYKFDNSQYYLFVEKLKELINENDINKIIDFESVLITIFNDKHYHINNNYEIIIKYHRIFKNDIK